MGHKIGVVSQKGGVGKSAVSRCLGAAHASFGWDVKIGDLDINQSTSYVWQKRRLASEVEPVVAVECFGTVSQALKQADNYDLFIFDGAPHATKATLEIAHASDMVVIPTGLSLDDMEPCVILANDLVKNGVNKDKIVFTFCRTGDSKAELEESLNYMAQTPYTAIPHPMPEKTAIRRAHDLGLSAIEARYKGPREASENLVQALIDKLNELTK
ncbi:ParA family protein [Photobacterium damselae]|uniref:ParA family protein n=1 Tax=Photobacterium damselae TaxID=38293 RepID=UPI001EFC570C|nr:ParA family protein [Photobacterium damselae]MCG9780462.1 ParA family protein [Photobacterium damselae]